MIERYVDPTVQLVGEIFVRDMERSKSFYQLLSFSVLADRGSFVVLTWEDHQLYLDEQPDQGSVPATPQINLRIMVPDVDRAWRLVNENELPVYSPVADRDYGLRDFTILDPDGIGLRFASRLTDHPPG